MSTDASQDSHVEYIRQLQDRAAIEALILRYCERFDSNDPVAVGDLFTPDAVIDYNPDTPNILGRDMAATIAVGLREIFAATSHHVSNIQVSFDDGFSARALSYVYAWHRYRADVPDGYLWGRYRHRFSRTGAGWKITELRLEAAGTRDFHRERMHPIGRKP
ncbi:MAG: nuclear transport factor 2 family protein [Halieaceae bacterium]|jgi:ketosteroid isomerase-like protein|nr:nuclear transport factor 2 family protein [Halieaceae bacterium]